MCGTKKGYVMDIDEYEMLLGLVENLKRRHAVLKENIAHYYIPQMKALAAEVEALKKENARLIAELERDAAGFVGNREERRGGE